LTSRHANNQAELSKAGSKLAHSAKCYQARRSYRSRWSHDDVQLSLMA